MMGTTSTAPVGTYKRSGARSRSVRSPAAGNQAAQGLDSFGMYLRDIARIPLLGADEERDIARRARDGDADALARLAESNLRFVVSMARRYARSGYPIDELVNEGNLGLLEAVRRFDPERGVRFTSYAGWWIRQAILAAIAHFGQAFSVPPKLRFEQYQFSKRVRELSQDLSRQPTVEEIASALEIDETNVRAMLDAVPGEVSLSEPIGDDGFEIGDTIADPRTSSVDDALMAQSFRRVLDLSLEQLSDKEQYVVERRFGLRGPGEPGMDHDSRSVDPASGSRGVGSDFVPATLAQIGKELDLSRERVRQLEARALDKLRRSEQAHQLRLFLGIHLN